MIILDTDHINILQSQHSNEFQNLTSKMSASADQDFFTTVITFEEQMRGWLARRQLAQARQGQRLQLAGLY